MNVLIVEDSPSARKLLRITLEHYGCTVIEAQDGEIGLDRAARHKPDIIISDALMPNMDGFQLLRALKADPELKSIPFIFYSSTYTGEKETELALSLGAEAFITKPAEPEQLWQKTCATMEAWESKRKSSAPPAIAETDEQYLRDYSRIVAAKLEEKVHELEEVLRQRQEADAALKERERELATIFENAPFIMLLLDSDRKVRRVNGLACNFADAPQEEMLGRKQGEALNCLYALQSPEGCGHGSRCRECAIRLTILDTFTTGRTHHQVEAQLPIAVRGKEQLVTFLLSTTKLTVAGEGMILLSLQNISDYKKLEAQLQQAQKMESIGTLAGGIAHDFNNILTSIFGYGEIALTKLGDDHPVRGDVEHMLQAAQRAASLSKDLLLFSRKQICDKRKLDLNDTVRTVEKFLLRIIGEDIAFTIGLDKETIPVFADGHQLEQVLMNLATNARDAMPNGGSLLITTERCQIDQAFVDSHGYGRCGLYAVLTVTDTGHGMNEETRRQVFDPFFTTKEIGKGTGLGMSVVYGIVKEHEGHIEIASEPDHGTTFRIYLPLVSSGEVQAVAREPEPAVTEQGTETILLAEDDENVRNIALSLLTTNGYEVVVAVDGEDAVQKFIENRDRIQLLLFDMIMPKKSGREAYEEIKELKPGVKAVFTSGYATDAVTQKTRNADHVLLISKPYSPANLLATIRVVLDDMKNLSSQAQ